MIIEIHHALIEMYQSGAGYIQEGNQYSGLKWLDSRPKPTEEQIQAKIQELQITEPMRLLRLERNRRLVETDWMALGDVTMTDAWKTYRQALRDITTQTPTDDALSNITFPTKPS